MGAAGKLTERRKNRFKSRLWGASTLALAMGAGWIVQFGVFQIPDLDAGLLESASISLQLVTHSVDEYVALIMGHHGGTPILQVLRAHDAVLSVFGRVAVVAIAAVAAAGPIRTWRLKTTPRRIATYWIDAPLPRWSEGTDAVRNANAAFARGIARTGRGLEIAPQVHLASAQEAKSLVVIGEPGSGKTTAILRLCYQLVHRKCLIVVHDVKGDLTARWPTPFVLLAPHDTRSWAWAVGQDIRGTTAARELAAFLIAASERDPTWGRGAQEILVGVIVALQVELGTSWGWRDLHNALTKSDEELREFACRHHPLARRFLALDEAKNFTRTAGSFVATLMAPIGRLIEPLAIAWGDVAPEYQFSVTQWLDQPNPQHRTLILQRAGDLPALSTAWIGTGVQTIARHLVASRKDRNPQDAPAKTTECWFILDEFAQLGPIAPEFLRLLEVGRSLGSRLVCGSQNFQQLARVNNVGKGDAAAELLQLTGTLVAFRMNPGPDAKRICDERLPPAAVRTWTAKPDRKTREPDSEDIPILRQSDLAELAVTPNGVEGYLISGNYAFGLTWTFLIAPIQREATVRASWIYENNPTTEKCGEDSENGRDG